MGSRLGSPCLGKLPHTFITDWGNGGFHSQVPLEAYMSLCGSNKSGLFFLMQSSERDLSARSDGHLARVSLQD